MSAPTPDPRNPVPNSRPRRGWWPSLGPLFYYDLVTATRRGQHSLLRSVAAIGLLLTLLVGYANHVPGFNALHPFAPLPGIHEPQQFATWFMYACLIVQVVGVFLIAPMVVADAIARDRETRMLEFLFATDLSDWEIVAGKLFSRLAYLAGALLAGLPVVAMTQLFGGVDRDRLTMGYATLLSCLFLVGAMGMASSVSAPNVVAATVGAYGAAAGYGGVFRLLSHRVALEVSNGIGGLDRDRRQPRPRGVRIDRQRFAVATAIRAPCSANGDGG